MNAIHRSLALIALASVALAQSGPYKIVKTAKVGGAGGFDYVYADPDGRRLYICRSGNGARVTVYNLDTLEPVGEIADTNGARSGGLHQVRTWIRQQQAGRHVGHQNSQAD